MPPTTAAMSPAISGAPEAIAMPSESGSATRNTTREAGRSCRRFCSSDGLAVCSVTEVVMEVSPIGMKSRCNRG
ncbi:Uncharacterised protein [Mycobacteroides abscessus subsp. abscessus]|nr:Uncharacterised protein [Mycobacteroides abscessus subsp. abscessus]SKU30806.1 Uncharacterised protein [Mycobacteroides abscessus subsp. abscessus]